eukprot:scaffold14591_cov140-Isochrysis_galbana.AAC.2
MTNRPRGPRPTHPVPQGQNVPRLSSPPHPPRFGVGARASGSRCAASIPGAHPRRRPRGGGGGAAAGDTGGAGAGHARARSLMGARRAKCRGAVPCAGERGC